jgi:hypothetical protein
MHITKKIQQVLRIAPLVILALLLSGCSVESDRTDKPSEDWSRGLFLGTTIIKQPVALQVDANEQAHLIWCGSVADEGDTLHYVRLNEQGQIVINEPLAIDAPHARHPQLLVDRENQLHLAWLSRVEGQDILYHALIDPNGQPTTPIPLSRAEENVSSFQMYLSAEGKIAFIWSSQLEDEPEGIFHFALHDTSPPTLLIPQGIDPFVLVDESGTTHLTWLYERGYLSRDLYYATLEGTQIAPGGGQKLGDFEFAESAIYRGPVIGADSHHIYVIWTIQNLGGGLTPTAAFAYYVSFEPGKPALVNPRTIGLPPDAMPSYTDHTSPYGYSELALVAPGYSSDFVNAPTTVQRQESELPVAFSLMVQSTAESMMQLAMAVLSEGELVGYQLASDTSSASVLSTMVADADASLHLAWLDTAGFRQYDVYYASTAPQVKAWLDRTSPDDVVLRVAHLIWGIVSGIGLVPIVAIWNLPPIIWLILFYMVSGQEELDQIGAKLGMLVTIIIYVASKLLFLPGLSAGTPFLYQVSSGTTATLTTAVPVAMLILALGAIYLYARRSDRASIFKAYLIFAIADGLLTIVLYAPQLFNPG